MIERTLADNAIVSATPIDTEASLLPPEHRLVLEPAGRGAFSVAYRGEVIVKRSHAPEREAARILNARGVNGRAVTFHAGSPAPRLRFDISRMAEIAARMREPPSPPTPCARTAEMG